MLTWVDGALVEADAATVSAFDHGLTVGDGVFETMKVVAGVPFALSRHLRRLESSARGLGLPLPAETDVRHAVAEVLAAAPAGGGPLRLRVTWTAGVAPLGSERGTATPTLVVAIAALGAWPETAVLATVPWTRNERGATVGVKTTSYAENVVALARARARGASEAVLANTRGELCEGTGSNIFLVLDGELLTPPLTSGCLAGVTRSLVLEWCGATERTVAVEELARAEEVFITSSTRDLQAVRAVDGRTLPVAPGPLTHRAQELFALTSAGTPDP